jgi:DNA-binding NarL/FixJ family response regulator
MKILICDDHALFRAGLRLVLRELEESTELLDASSAEETLRIADAEPALDLVLLDLGMPGMGGLAALGVLRERFPTLPVVIVSASERHADVRGAIDRGAAGFIPKSSSAAVLLAALRLVLSGGVYLPPLVLATSTAAAPASSPATDRRRERAAALTPRQLEVLDLMAKGRTNREICEALGIAEGTTKAHVATILEALDVANRTEAGAAMRDLGLDTARPRAPEPAPEAGPLAAESLFRREGEYWTIRHRGSECHLRDSKGVRYLAFLLRNAGRECHVLEVAVEGRADTTASPGGAPDDRGMHAEDAGEVAGAVGAGERDRPAASASERARQNVSRSVKMVLDRLGESSPDLASHLHRTIRTGTFCSYMPDPGAHIRWTF